MEKQLKSIKFPGLDDIYVIPEGGAGAVDIDLEGSAEGGVKPQSPLQHTESGDYFYPLTTIDQVIMEDGSRLNDCNFLTVDNGDSIEGEVVPVNADTLGGHKAEDFVKKSDAMVVTKNYCVVGGTEVPENPTENMIWVQTDVEIGNVYFSGIAPSNCIDNDIWISTNSGASTIAFDSIRIGNDTMNTVYPISAKQYVGGTWVDKTVKSYQGGAWVDWITYLYKAPDEYTDLTGGWTKSGFTVGSYGLGSLTKTDTSMTIKGVSGSTFACVVTANKVDVSAFNSINVRVSSGDAVQIRLTTNVNLSDAVSGFYGKYNVPVENGVATLSLVGVTGSYYLAIMNDLTITEVYAK